jgi:hypothetical protein
MPLSDGKIPIQPENNIAHIFKANPFARRESHSVRAVWTYKVLTILTWLLNVLASVYYTFGIPADDKVGWRNTIWGHNKDFPTPFALNAIIASLYW